MNEEFSNRCKEIKFAIKFAKTKEDYDNIERAINILEASIPKPSLDSSNSNSIWISYENGNPRCKNLKRLIRD